MMKDVIVIGAGPAGLTAAIQLSRSGLSVSVFDPAGPGGTIRYAHRVENIPGFEFGASGEDVASGIASTAFGAGIMVDRIMVDCILVKDDMFVVRSDREDGYPAKVVIIATGLADEEFSTPDYVTQFIHGSLERPSGSVDEKVLVIGGGDVSFDVAMKWCDSGYEVTLLHRTTPPPALPRLVDIAKSEGVEVINGEIGSWKKADESVLAEILIGGGSKKIFAHHVIPCIGRKPNYRPIIVNGNEVELLTGENSHGETNLCNMFIAGDVKHPEERQVTLAMGDGMSAAIEIIKRLGK